MKTKNAMLRALCLLFLQITIPAYASEILLDDYRNGLSPKWEEKSFMGKTRYRLEQVDREWCIRADSQSSASALYFKIRYDLKNYPILRWKWKIEHIISKGNALHKETDDYPARIYVVFPSVLFWRTRAINYIWANRLPVDKWLPNAYTANAVMIAVESGPSRAGEWREETRDVLKDYRTVFGEDPPEAGAVAIMTDTDNTGETATAWYGPIRLLSAALP